MKTIELKNQGVVYYGTPKELKTKALEVGVELPRIEDTRHSLNCGSGRTMLFSSKSKHPDVDLEQMRAILLDCLLYEVSGEEISREDCYNLAKQHESNMKLLAEEVK